MKKFSVKDLAWIIKARDEKRETRDASFTGVSIDSRTTKAGDCFFAIEGDNFDGHDYVADAFDKGAVCAVVRKDESEKFTGYSMLNVEDTIKALGDFAREYRRLMGFKVVAITGSTGKTTTRQIIHHVLSRCYRCCQAPKNFNNNIGLPLTLLGATGEEEIVIVELGSNHPGEIAYLTRIAQPDIAVVTNVYPVHLAGFGDLQTIVKEKLSIAEGLLDRGVLIINADIANRAPSIEIITFGKSNNADTQAMNISYTGFGSEFTIDETKVVLPLPGAGNVENALAAWAVCSRFAITIDDFAHAVKSLSAVPMRCEPLQIGTLTALNDCYNANPASMKNALEILANLGSTQKRRLVFICGDMAELGKQSERLHNELGEYIVKAKVRLLLTVGEFAKITAQAAKAIAGYDLQIKCFEDTASLCNNMQKFIKDSDIILIKGSRTANLETAVEKLKKLFA